jgi:glycerol-3-phosphate acyltransferase PlsY
MRIVEIGCLLGCYLLGAIPFGLLVGLGWRGIDIRKFGSGNIGATNILRTLGPVPAALVFLLDTGKGFAAVVIAAGVLGDSHRAGWVLVGCAFLAILGHTASPFLVFRGGKGVATALGVSVGIAPLPAALCLALWILVVLVWRYISVASMIAGVAMPFAFLATRQPHQYLAYVIPMAVLVVVKHIPNIRRLLAGTEPKIGRKAKVAAGEESG